MTKIDFIEFLKEFRKDLNDNQSKWQNVTLDDFLEAMERYTSDVQGYYDNMNLKIDSNVATWDNFKTILKGAAVYE